MPKNMRAAPTTHLVLLGDGTHSKGDMDQRKMKMKKRKKKRVRVS
jgi:hypothetical protein